MRTRTIVLPFAALALGFTAACGVIGQTEPEPTVGPPLSTASEAPSATVDGLTADGGYDAPPAPVDATSEAPRPGITTFGTTTTYPDVEFNVGEPQEFVPSKYAAGLVEGQETVAFNITLFNLGDAPFDPSLFSTSVSSGGAEASQIFDGEDLGSTPSTPVLPGKSVTFKVGYSVADPADIVLQATPDFSHTSAIYANAS